MKTFFKTIIGSIVFGAMVFAGWQVYLKWKEFQLVLTELEEKDPEKYARMEGKAKSFHIEETMKLYREIDTMPLAEIIDLKYKNFLKKRSLDEKFKEESYGEEHRIREKERKAKLQNDQSKIEELKTLKFGKPLKARFGKWEKIKPWQQRLILREKCIKFFKKEKAEKLFNQDVLKASKLTTLLSRPGKKPLKVKYLCEDLISKAASPKEIQNSILRIKETMNFYYFSQLLEETGIPRTVVFPFNEELTGLTRDYNDF